MDNLPRSAQIYIGIVFSLGAIAALLSIPAFLYDPGLILPAALFAVLIAVLDLMPVSFPGHNFEVVPSAAIKLAGVLLLPPPVVLVAVFCGNLLSELRLKRIWYKLIFNVGALTLTYTVVIWLYNLVREPGIGILGSERNVAAVILMGIADVGLNSLVIALILALSRKQSVSYVWVQTWKPILLNDLTVLPIGVFLAMLWQAVPLSIILVFPPLFLARRAYQIVVDLETQTRQALFALARVLDERDRDTSHHCELVAKYAETIARQMGLGADEVDIIIRAAWLHDIGKVGMANDILFKPGPLTPDERERAKQHAVIGSDLLTKFPRFDKGAVYVRHHHERWDGTGYPDKLKGNQIPLGARILAVADSYQAMTAERPYRKPMSEESALDQLRRNAGAQFDPQVVQAFLRTRQAVVQSPIPMPVTSQIPVSADQSPVPMPITSQLSVSAD